MKAGSLAAVAVIALGTLLVLGFWGLVRYRHSSNAEAEYRSEVLGDLSWGSMYLGDRCEMRVNRWCYRNGLWKDAPLRFGATYVLVSDECLCSRLSEATCENAMPRGCYPGGNCDRLLPHGLKATVGLVLGKDGWGDR
jgi:hypothetical protein